ncbi:MAG: hypothetical protein J5685_03280 [Clostridiales bacterium]|nr:hypothetical protein [Clostridiales bacterium]
MALWDDAAETSSVKCPNCAGNLVFDVSLSKNYCKNCGGLFMPETFESAGTLEFRDLKPAADEEEDKTEFVCDSCGAVLVTDENTAATFCAFCGSPTLIKRRLTQEFRPDYIIPFKITKEDACNRFREYVKATKYAPNDFVTEDGLKKITGFYVPFWLLDAVCHTDIIGSGVINDLQTKTVFNIDRTIDFKVRKVPFDGSKKISNLLMEAIEPYDYSELKPYNDMYIPGFFAQRYDESALDMTERIQSRMDSHARQLVKNFAAKEYNEVSVSSNSSYSTDFSQSYALFPVWFLRYKYKDLNYTFVVNGQTGEVSGSVPYSNIKRNARIAVEAAGWPILALLVVIGLIIGWVAALKTGNRAMFQFFFETIYYFVIIMATIIPTLIGIIIYRVKKVAFDTTNPIDSAPDVDQYIDFGTKFHMEKRDTFGYIATKMNDNERGEKNLGEIIGRLIVSFLSRR